MSEEKSNQLSYSQKIALLNDPDNFHIPYAIFYNPQLSHREIFIISALLEHSDDQDQCALTDEIIEKLAALSQMTYQTLLQEIYYLHVKTNFITIQRSKNSCRSRQTVKINVKAAIPSAIERIQHLIQLEDDSNIPGHGPGKRHLQGILAFLKEGDK